MSVLQKLESRRGEKSHKDKKIGFNIVDVSNCVYGTICSFTTWADLDRYMYIKLEVARLNKKRWTERSVQRLSSAVCSSSFIGHLNLEIIGPNA